MISIKTNKITAIWILTLGISLTSSEGLVGVSPDHPPGRTVPQLLLTAVRVELAIPFLPKVGEIFEATITIYCKNDLEYCKAGPDYRVQFEGDVEIIEGREHIIHGYLKKGETRRFKAKMVIKEAKEKVGIGGSIVAMKPVPFGQGAYIEMFLLDPETGQYGTKQEYNKRLFPLTWRYDPADGIWLDDGHAGYVEWNRRIIATAKKLEPALSDSEALCLHADIVNENTPYQCSGPLLPGKTSVTEEELFDFLFKRGWLWKHRAVEATKKVWLKQLSEENKQKAEELQEQEIWEK